MDRGIRVGLIADHLLFRVGVTQALRSSPRLSIVAEGECFDAAVSMAEDPGLDLLLIEIEIPGDGLEAARAIQKKRSHAKVVIITALENEQLVIDALRAGVQGYILKDVTGPDLVRALETIHRGEPYISPTLASRLLRHLATKAGTLLVNREASLSTRERQVLSHMAEGLTNREIAAKLGITLKTIKQHTTLLFSKIGVRNRIEAAAAARVER